MTSIGDSQVAQLARWIALPVLLVALLAWPASKWLDHQQERLALSSRVEALSALLSAGYPFTPGLRVCLAQRDPAPGLEQIVWADRDEVLYMHPEPVLNSESLSSARVSKDVRGAPAVRLQLTEAAAREFQRFSRENLGSRLAFIVGEEVLSVPLIARPVTESYTLIEHVGSEQEARRLAIKMSRR